LQKKLPKILVKLEIDAIRQNKKEKMNMLLVTKYGTENRGDLFVICESYGLLQERDLFFSGCGRDM